MFEYSIDVTIPHLVVLFNKIMQEQIYPDLWCQAIITPIFKKGSANDINNYRGIYLLCTLGKIFTKIIGNRFLTWSEQNNKFDEGQGAYRKGRSTVENIFTLYSMCEKYLSRPRGRFHFAFTKAFDSIPHNQLWYQVITNGVHGNLLKVLQNMYSKSKSCVWTMERLNSFFDCQIGTRQGCMISPSLFIRH